MAYLLSGVDITNIYGIIPGYSGKGSNIAMSGVYDLPKRTGVTFKDWGDSDGVEPFVDSTDMHFAGRDLTFNGLIKGTYADINNKLNILYNAIKGFTSPVILSTPRGNFSIIVKSVKPEFLNGGAKITILLREPVVTLTGGTLPATAISDYTIDSIPFLSFGLYLSKADALHDLPELKEQFFTKYGSEGFQISKRKNNTIDINGFILASSLSDFQSKIKALYLLFSNTGTRLLNLKGEGPITCFATSGFTIDNILFSNTGMVAGFKMNLICTLAYDWLYDQIILGNSTYLI